MRRVIFCPGVSKPVLGSHGAVRGLVLGLVTAASMAVACAVLRKCALDRIAHAFTFALLRVLCVSPFANARLELRVGGITEIL